MIIYGVWARIASYVSPKSCKFSPKCYKRRAVLLIFEIIICLGLILQGALKKDYIYTKDIARALALMAQHTSEGAFNIGSGQAVSIREFSECVARQLNACDLLNFQDNCSGQAPLILADTNRLVQELGFKPLYTLEESIKEIIQDYNAQ